MLSELEKALVEDMGTFECPRCAQVKPVNPVDTHMCKECAAAENVRYTHARQHQDWLAVSKESGIDPWLQQPGETQWEYTIWCAYRDSYPGKKPTYASVARELGTTYNVVKLVSKRWTFPVRMQLWMKECENITLLQRRDEILEMNKAHTDLAAKIRDKVDKFVDIMQPENMKVSEAATMLKLSAELERQARIDSIAQAELRDELLRGDEHPEVKKDATSKDDLQTVVDILVQAGAITDVTRIGVKQTTEVVMMGADGSRAALTTGGSDGEDD